MNFLSWYVALRVRYDSITRKMSEYFWGERFSFHRLLVHLLVIAVFLGIVFHEAVTTGDYRQFKIFLILASFDLIGMFWKWGKQNS